MKIAGKWVIQFMAFNGKSGREIPNEEAWGQRTVYHAHSSLKRKAGCPFESRTPAFSGSRNLRATEMSSGGD